jgi:hypothetical protein
MAHRSERHAGLYVERSAQLVRLLAELKRVQGEDGRRRARPFLKRSTFGKSTLCDTASRIIRHAEGLDLWRPWNSTQRSTHSPCVTGSLRSPRGSAREKRNEREWKRGDPRENARGSPRSLSPVQHGGQSPLTSCSGTRSRTSLAASVTSTFSSVCVSFSGFVRLLLVSSTHILPQSRTSCLITRSIFDARLLGE